MEPEDKSLVSLLPKTVDFQTAIIVCSLFMLLCVSWWFMYLQFFQSPSDESAGRNARSGISDIVNWQSFEISTPFGPRLFLLYGGFNWKETTEEIYPDVRNNFKVNTEFNIGGYEGLENIPSAIAAKRFYAEYYYADPVLSQNVNDLQYLAWDARVEGFYSFYSAGIFKEYALQAVGELPIRNLFTHEYTIVYRINETDYQAQVIKLATEPILGDESCDSKLNEEFPLACLGNLIGETYEIIISDIVTIHPQ